jgi:CelD/BcsL family acetyltransferase involved in cellulose biosynthesis
MLLTHGTRTAITLPFEQSWPDYVGSLSPDVQGDLRGVLDRGADLDDVEFQLMTPSPAEVPELLATLAELAPSPWMNEKGAPLRVFYRALATRAAARGTLRVGVLHAGGRLVAFQWGLEAYRRLWLLSRAHDTAANWSPDVVLMSHLIRVAHEQRLAAVEFWGDDAPWQMRWQPAARTFASTMAVPLTARGLSGLAIDAMSRGARRWLPSAWTLPTSPLESGL